MGKFCSFLLSYWYLIYFYIEVRRKGLPAVVNIMKDKVQGKKRRWISEPSIVSGYQLACKMHFLNVECLERSLALYLLLSINSYESRLCIGIRHKPFLSHAWVESKIKTIDESDNRNKFHVFLTLPVEGVEDVEYRLSSNSI
jgi:hypothetical protein